MTNTVYRVEMMMFEPDVTEYTSFDTMKEAVKWANEHISEYDAYDVYEIDVNTFEEEVVWSDKVASRVRRVIEGIRAGR